MDVKFGKSSDDLATRENRWRCDDDWKTSQFLLSDRSELGRFIGVGVYGDNRSEMWRRHINQDCL